MNSITPLGSRQLGARPFHWQCLGLDLSSPYGSAANPGSPLVCGTLPPSHTAQGTPTTFCPLEPAHAPQKLLDFPLAALFPLELTGTNQGELDTPDEPKGVHQ
jgi:hypothetical protein